jgi:erythromycin esterase
MNDSIADDDVPIEGAFDGVFPIWTRSAQVRPTLEYVRHSTGGERPITQVGMDAQLTGRNTAEALRARATALLGTLDAPAPESAVAGLELLAGLGNAPPDEHATSDIAERLGTLSAFLDTHLETLKQEHDPREVELVARSVDDAAWFCGLLAAQAGAGDLDPDLLNERDRRMGDNLAWLAETYFPDRRIIVWAATRHAVHRQKEIEFPDSPGLYDNMDSMGETAHARLGNALYTIGFTAGRGKVCNVFRDQPYDIGPPRAGSIEASLAEVGKPFLFLDFRALPADHPLREVQWMRPLGYAWQRAKWPEQMDGLVYIDTMFPSTGGDQAPADYQLTVPQ